MDSNMKFKVQADFDQGLDNSLKPKALANRTKVSLCARDFGTDALSRCWLIS
jgi:hypothetical protein